jgi:plasmid maintenance system antidote protein VapI
MNALQEKLTELKLKDLAAAKIVGVYPSTIFKHRTGARQISPGMAVRYHSAFGIPLADMCPDLPWPAPGPTED